MNFINQVVFAKKKLNKLRPIVGHHPALTINTLCYVIIASIKNTFLMFDKIIAI